MAKPDKQKETPEHIPAWERPEHQTPRIEEPDNSKARVWSLLFVFAPLVVVLLLMIVGGGIVACQVISQDDSPPPTLEMPQVEPQMPIPDAQMPDLNAAP